ncbi:MAG: endonuclease/exonuclease/phosphatase family protein [Candidatus Limnocylindrales bacterium]
MRRLPFLLACLAALAVVEVAVNVVLRPQVGPPALAAVFEPHLLAAGAVAGVLAILLTLADRGSGASRMRLVGVVVVVLAVVRLGGEWWSPGGGSDATSTATAPSGATRITFMSWNLELGARAAAATAEAILGIPDTERPQVVALQELTPDAAAAIEAVPNIAAIYPYRILEPRNGVEGMGLLSTLPLVVGGYASDPMLLRAGLLLPDGSRVELFDVHPFPPRIATLGGVPWGIDARRRDADLATLAAAVAGAPDPARVIVVGDLNTTPFEPGFAIIAGGLRDAHDAVGSGTGFTWRPGFLEPFDMGLLRIDHVLSGASVTPVAETEDCSLVGDHCRLFVTVEVAPGG